MSPFIKDLPIEIQEHIKDYHKLYPYAGRDGRLLCEFDWKKTPEGNDFWNAIDNGNIDVFFKKYPEKEFVLPEKWYIKTTSESNEIVCDWFNKETHGSTDRSVGNYYRSTNGELSGWMYDALEYTNGYTEITFEQFKKYVMKQEERKIIGYKAPFDMFCEDIKQGNVFVQSAHSDYFCCKGNSLPKEIVKTWEPVYKEEETTVTIGSKNVVVTIKNNGDLRFKNGMRSSVAIVTNLIDDFKKIEPRVVEITQHYTAYINTHARFIRIGCEEENNLFSINDLKSIVDEYNKLKI